MARTSRGARSRGRGSTRTRTSARTGVIEVFTRPESSLLVRFLGLVVRLRAELTIVTVLLVARFWAWPRLVELLGHTAALLTVTVLILSILVTPASRRYLSRRWWSITTRHRMRACFAQTRTMTHHGRMPLLVWSRPSPVGERVRVWLPAGLSVKDLERVIPETATACWASDVRVTPNRRQAAMVTVDVIRRDPLTGDALRPDDLDAIEATDADGTEGTLGTVVPLPNRHSLPPPASRDLPDTGTTGTSTNGAGGQNGSRTRTRKSPAAAGDTASNGPDEPPTTGFGGVDVSDYV